jgi:hypothetical protein
VEREEVKQLLMTMEVDFPSFRVDAAKLSFTINAWYRDLASYDISEVWAAYQTFKNTANSAFAPSTSQILGCMTKIEELANISVSEAWAMVRVAIGKSAYNSKEEFLKLPELIQKAVGSAEQLHYWAIDNDFNDSVVMSVFEKNYQAVINRNTDELRLPVEAKARLEQIRKDNIALIDNNTYLIGQKADKLQEGDFNYDELQRPDNETIGHYAQQLRKDLGVE